MKGYVDFCTEQRKQSLNDFEKNLWKLAVNSQFGKTIEGVRDKISVELVHTPKRLEALVAQPTYKSFKIFSPHLAAVHNKRKKIILNKPIPVGFCILDFAKHKMYDFYYNYLKRKYGCRVKLLTSDTDSFIIFVETEDIYQDIFSELDLFDTSNFPKDHFLYTAENKQVIGKMKFETGAVPIKTFAGLQAKMYAFQCESEDGNEHTTKKAKGVSNSIIKKNLKFNHYKTCLFHNETFYFTSHCIRSQNHNIRTMCTRKKSLSCFDDKRWVLNHPSHQTLALGHYQIPYIEKILSSFF
jgi:hypothetical protein